MKTKVMFPRARCLRNTDEHGQPRMHTDKDDRRRFGATPPFLPPFSPRPILRRLLHPRRLGRLEVRLALQSLETRDLFSLRRYFFFEPGNFAQQRDYQPLQFFDGKIINVGTVRRRCHTPIDSEKIRPFNRKSVLPPKIRPPFCPSYAFFVRKLAIGASRSSAAVAPVHGLNACGSGFAAKTVPNALRANTHCWACTSTHPTAPTMRSNFFCNSEPGTLWICPSIGS